MTKRCSKNSLCDFYLDPLTLKHELIRGIVVPNICVKLYQNWIINEVSRAMTKGEHTYVHTYVWDRSYIPSTTLLRKGIIIYSWPGVRLKHINIYT